VSLCAGLCALGWAAGADFNELAAGAAAARRANHIPEAIELYKQALALKGDWPEGWWFVGTLSYSLYHYADCEEALGQFVRLDQARALAWALDGLCEFETGHYDAALLHLEKGLATPGGLAPEVEAGARFHDGMLLTRAARFDRGRRQLERFARMGAGEPSVVTAIGLNALRERLLPQEIPEARKELVMAAGKAARAWMAGETSEADAAFAALVARYSAGPGVHYLYGTYLGTARPEEARAEFERELKIDPENGAAEAMLALLLPDDAEGALRHAKKAAAKTADDPLAQYAYGKALVENGGVEAGIERLKVAIRLDPGTLSYHTALAIAEAKAGRDAEAREERALSKAIAMGLDDDH
jgi:tetratricopeptide (TPR) repeat protein